jgi:hypothetical protein
MLIVPALPAVDFEAEYWASFGFGAGIHFSGMIAAEPIGNGLFPGAALDGFVFFNRTHFGVWFGILASTLFNKYKNEASTLAIPFSLDRRLGGAFRIPINDENTMLFAAGIAYSHSFYETTGNLINADIPAAAVNVCLKAAYKFNFYDDILFLMAGSDLYLDILSLISNFIPAGDRDSLSWVSKFAIKPFLAFGINFYHFRRAEGGLGRGW